MCVGGTDIGRSRKGGTGGESGRKSQSGGGLLLHTARPGPALTCNKDEHLQAPTTETSLDHENEKQRKERNNLPQKVNSLAWTPRGVLIFWS